MQGQQLLRVVLYRLFDWHANGQFREMLTKCEESYACCTAVPCRADAPMCNIQPKNGTISAGALDQLSRSSRAGLRATAEGAVEVIVSGHATGQ